MADLPEGLTDIEIERVSTALQVAEVLRDRILTGQLPPGYRLRETVFSSFVGVSRNTFREALRLLEHEGLITHAPHRGAIVTQLSAADVSELYGIRRIVELAAVNAIAEAPPADLSDLNAAVVGMEDAVASGAPQLLLDHDFAFHRALVSRCAISRLDAFYRTVQTELRLALAQLDRHYDTTPQVKDHRIILEALVAKDFDRAATTLESHLVTAAERLATVVDRPKEAQVESTGD